MSDDLVRRLSAETPETEELRRRVFDLERRLAASGDTEKRAKDAEARAQRLERELGILSSIGDRSAPPAWLTRTPKKQSHSATAWLMLSDLHLDEVVEPDQVMHTNAYDREIAVGRLERTFVNFLKVTKDNWTSVNYDGAVLALGGDLFSGDIHDELKETNEDTILGSLDFWLDHLAAGISLVADEFGAVHVPCVVGNHGRTTRKPRAKFRARSNFDWFMGRALQRMFRTDKRVTFDVAESADTLVQSYGSRVMLTHGDQASGGAGIGGIWPPIMRLDARKRQRQEAVGQGYDLLVMGHWHTLTLGKSFIVNGCFPSGSKVMTSTGYTLIEDVAEGDSVMSRDGTEQKVTYRFEREADRMVGLKVKGLPNVLWATPNHLLWASKAASRTVTPVRRHLIDAHHGPAQWVPIDFLSQHDLVHVPFPKGNERPVTNEDAWAYGLFLAEGSALLDGGSSKKHNRISLVMHANEREHVERWAAWFDAKFNTTSRIYHRPSRTTTDLAVSAGRDVSLWFQQTFGHRAGNKHLPDGALWWADDLKASLLDGWILGDGHVGKQTDCRDAISATTISERLAWGMFHIGPTLGRWPSLHKLSAGGPRKSDSYTVTFNTGQDVEVINGEAFYRIAERFDQHGTFRVFDLEVTGEHTYNVEGIGVHNSLKGQDEYGFIENFGFEQPQQACWLMTPEHGMTWTAPIFCQDRQVEGW